MINRQKQNAGDNSTQIIGQNIIIGIDEKRAREICDEKFQIVKEQLTIEARETANLRMCEFENILVDKMKKIDGTLQSFSDPSFQLLLIEAQKSAAQSDCKSDYELLSELLVHKHLNRSSRETVSGINRAVKIVHEISSDALLALTVTHVIDKILPVSGDVMAGIAVMDDCFSKIIDSSLPCGIEWIEHAELLGAVRIIPFQSHPPPLTEVFKKKLDGYICLGIQQNSIEHAKALQIISANDIPDGILVENSINPGYVRLNIARKNHIGDLYISHVSSNYQDKTPLTEAQKLALHEVLALYSNDAIGLENSVKAFTEEWDRRSSLEKISKWWPTINAAFQFTQVGTVLSHANAQRCDSKIPNL